MPTSDWEFRILWCQLDSGHLDDNLQPRFLELLRKSMTVLGGIEFGIILEWVWLRLHGLTEVTPPLFCLVFYVVVLVLV
jgi:hypothetical protein